LTLTVDKDFYIERQTFDISAMNNGVTSNIVPVNVDLSSAEVTLAIVDSEMTNGRLENVGDFVSVEAISKHPKSNTI
jgi:hypothetical protein